MFGTKILFMVGNTFHDRQTCWHVGVHVCMYMYMYIHMYMCYGLHVCTYVWYVCTHICLHAWHVCMYVCCIFFYSKIAANALNSVTGQHEKNEAVAGTATAALGAPAKARLGAAFCCALLRASGCLRQNPLRPEQLLMHLARASRARKSNTETHDFNGSCARDSRAQNKQIHNSKFQLMTRFMADMAFIAGAAFFAAFSAAFIAFMAFMTFMALGAIERKWRRRACEHLISQKSNNKTHMQLCVHVAM